MEGRKTRKQGELYCLRGVIPLCPATDGEIDGFGHKPVLGRRRLIEICTARLIRIYLVIPNRPNHPFLFESFLNVAQENETSLLELLGRTNGSSRSSM